MTKQHFSPQEVFMFGWTKTKQHAWFLFLTFMIISVIASAVNHVSVVVAIVNIMTILSVTSISIAISRNHEFTFRDLYMPLLSSRRVLKFAGLSVLYGFFTTLGFKLMSQMGPNPLAVLSTFIVLVIPGIYIAVRFMFYPYIVVEHEHTSLPDLIKMSYKMTRDHFWMLAAFLILVVAINLIGSILMVFSAVGHFIGAVLFLLGLASLGISVPVSIFASAHMYNKFKDHINLTM